MRLIDADKLIEYWERDRGRKFDADYFIHTIEHAPTIEPKTKVIAQVTFDEDKLREIAHEAVERIKEKYDIIYDLDAITKAV